MKLALYARVSTKQNGQDPDNQLIQMRSAAAAKGHTVVQEYVDWDTGSHGNREAFVELWREVISPRRKFDGVMVWALDRLSREGVLKTLDYLDRFKRANCAFISHREEYLDTTGPFRDVIISLMAVLAQQERIRMRERSLAGIERARAEGKKFGRKPLDFNLKAARAMRLQGMSLREVAKALGTSAAMVRRRLQAEPAQG
jgi:DNA invertase Pin-like site-specific DNA recombinase